MRRSRRSTSHGAYVTPGLIDAHVHIESSLLVPAQFAAAVLPHGVTSIVADPHEIANVAGVAGIRYMAAACAGLPLSVFLMAPSCVPATAMESNGARLEAEDLAPLLQEGIVHGLAEMMNYPGVTGGDPAILAKLEAFRGRPIDGHAPGWLGKALNAYVAAGIDTEHECTTVAEAQEKLGRGLYILIRQATNAQNLRTLLPLVTPPTAGASVSAPTTASQRICWTRAASTLWCGRRSTMASIPSWRSRWRRSTWPSALGCRDRGAIAPGRRADLLMCDDLRDLRPRQVYAGGQLVAEAGSLLTSTQLPSIPLPPTVGASVNVAWPAVDFRIPARGQFMRVIGCLARPACDRRTDPACAGRGWICSRRPQSAMC